MNNENVQVVKKLMESEIERIQQRFSSEDCELNKHIIAVLKSLKAIYERLDQVDCAMESVFLNRKLNLQVWKQAKVQVAFCVVCGLHSLLPFG